jgi:hypothetical protein
MAGESGPKEQTSGKWRKEQLGREPWIYRPGMSREASAIKVARFRQILLWPLTLRLPNPAAAGAEIVPDARCVIAESLARGETPCLSSSPTISARVSNATASSSPIITPSVPDRARPR